MAQIPEAYLERSRRQHRPKRGRRSRSRSPIHGYFARGALQLGPTKGTSQIDVQGPLEWSKQQFIAFPTATVTGHRFTKKPDDFQDLGEGLNPPAVQQSESQPLMADLFAGPNVPLTRAFIFCGWRTLSVDWLLDPTHDLSNPDRHSLEALQSIHGVPQCTLEKARVEMHRNLYTEEAYMENIYKAAEHPVILKYPNDAAWQNVEAEMFAEFQKLPGVTKALSTDEAFARMKDSVAGWPLKGSRQDPENIATVRRQLPTFRSRFRTSSPDERTKMMHPYTGLTRTQLAIHPRTKVRMVCCMPMILLVLQISGLHDILESVRMFDWFASGYTLSEQQSLIDAVVT